MDKQITELTRSKSADLLEFSKSRDRGEEPEDDDARACMANEEFFSGFQFRPRRVVASLQPRASALRNFNSMDDIDVANAGGREAGICCDATAWISVIDRKMKEYTEEVLHAVESLSARLSQLETRMKRFENSIDELKGFMEYNHGRTDGKLRELENILREVQSGVVDLRDKQVIAEAQLHLAKLQSKGKKNSAQGTSSSAPQQIHYRPLAVPYSSPQQPPPSSPISFANQPLENPMPIANLASHFPSQLPQVQVHSLPQPESLYPQPMLTPQSASLQYYPPPTQQSQQQYPLAPQLPLISQSPQLPISHLPLSQVNLQAHHPSDPYTRELSYVSSQGLPSSTYKSSDAAGGFPNHRIHDESSSYHYSEFPPGQIQPHRLSSSVNHYSFNEYPPSHSNSIPRPSQVQASDLGPGELPRALPMATILDSGSDSSRMGTKNESTNDIIENFVAMGFRRDLVRATVRKITESGQSVDLNVVLDKLMNER